MRKLGLIAALAGAMIAGAAIAAGLSTGNEFSTATPGKTVVGFVEMVWNASLGYAQPASFANPLPVAAGASNASTAGLPATSPSSALSSNWVGCSATCNLYDFQVSTTTASVWVMAFDATALPSNGAVTPKKWWQVAANATLGVAWSGEPPLNLTNGLVLGCSTTGPFTLTASATCSFSGGVKQ